MPRIVKKTSFISLAIKASDTKWISNVHTQRNPFFCLRRRQIIVADGIETFNGIVFVARVHAILSIPAFLFAANDEEFFSSFGCYLQLSSKY